MSRFSRVLSTKRVMFAGTAFIIASALAAGAFDRTARAAESAVVIPTPVVDDAAAAGGLKTAVLAGGCFWGMQGVFEHVKGVEQVVSGYAGGSAATAQYETVSTGRTGHAESVEITYDPAKITYGKLLQVYFSVAHDPTQLNRQGPDRGTQYRSVVFYSDASQERIVEAYLAQLEAAHVFAEPIVTKVDPLPAFYPAEAYHQDYLIHHPDSPYIVINDLPKIADLERLFPDLYQEAPAAFESTKAPT